MRPGYFQSQNNRHGQSPNRSLRHNIEGIKNKQREQSISTVSLRNVDAPEIGQRCTDEEASQNFDRLQRNAEGHQNIHRDLEWTHNRKDSDQHNANTAFDETK